MSNSSTINVDIVVNDSRATAAVKSFGKEVSTAGNTGAKSMTSLRTESQSAGITLGSIVKSAVAATGAFYAMQGAATAIFGEFKRGLGAIEDFNLSVASSAAFITTFSDRTKSGDLAGGFQEANIYAQALNSKLEMLDMQTIASGKDLQIMNETMLQHGVILDINNQKQVTGFTNIATALALVTQGQNKDIQMRQEINALLNGQVRATDRLPKLLSAIDPHLQEHLKKWKEEGTLIENVGEMLKGFAASTGNLDDLWITVGATLETIHNRVLRGAFKPIFEDLIGLTKTINKSLMDAEGNLTPLAESIQNDITSGYREAKELIDEYGGGLVEFAGYALAAKSAQVAFNAVVGANPYVLAAGAVYALNEAIKTLSSEENSMALTSLDNKLRAAATSIGNIADVWKGLRDSGTGAVFSEQELALRRIAELQDQLANQPWSLFKDPVAEKRHLTEVNAEIGKLKSLVNDMQNIDELSRASGSNNKVLITVPTISNQGADDLKKQLELLKEYKKEQEEQAKAEREMYQEAGLGAEAYFSQEANELVQKAGRWKKAGADVYEIEQWLYEQLGKLGTEAYEKNEFAAGQTMDSIQAMSGAIVEQFGHANSSITGVLDSMGISIDELNGKQINITANFDGSKVLAGVDQVIAKLNQLGTASASASAAKLSASSSIASGRSKTAHSSMSADEVAASLSASAGGNSPTVINNNFNQQVSRSDVTAIINEQKRLEDRS
jgi:hypothetical protein